MGCFEFLVILSGATALAFKFFDLIDLIEGKGGKRHG